MRSRVLERGQGWGRTAAEVGGPWGMVGRGTAVSRGTGKAKAVGSADSTRCAEPRLVRVSGQRLVDALVFLAASALAFASAFAFAASFFF